jgi:hypothetical protein
MFLRNITLSTPADVTMNTLHEFIQSSETFLNSDPILKRRNDHIKSTIGDNRALLEVLCKSLACI